MNKRKKTQIQKKDISRFENMTYHEDIDAFECSQGKLLKRQKDTYRTRKKKWLSRNFALLCMLRV